MEYIIIEMNLFFWRKFEWFSIGRFTFQNINFFDTCLIKKIFETFN